MIESFALYKQIINLYKIFNEFDGGASIPDDCIGYLRNIICYSNFPACSDKGNDTFVNYYLN